MVIGLAQELNAISFRELFERFEQILAEHLALFQKYPRNAEGNLDLPTLFLEPINFLEKNLIRRKITFPRRPQKNLLVDLVIKIIIEVLVLFYMLENLVLPEKAPFEPEGLMNFENQYNIRQFRVLFARLIGPWFISNFLLKASFPRALGGIRISNS